MTFEHRITLTVNGELLSCTIEPRLSLADFLRDHMHLTGTHLGCEMGACGACLVLLNGEPVHACLVLAAQTDGEVVETIEGIMISAMERFTRGLPVKVETSVGPSWSK